MVPLIALYGPQQVGKTTAAFSLVENHDFKHRAFADPLYRMLAALMEISVEEIRKLPKNEPIKALEGKTLRQALQALGSEWGRELIGGEIWVNTARRSIISDITSGIPVVIDDCRFLNEYEMLRDIGARFVRISRADMPEQTDTHHDSEQDWPSFPMHCEAINDSNHDYWKQFGGETIFQALRNASPPVKV